MRKCLTIRKIIILGIQLSYMVFLIGFHFTVDLFAESFQENNKAFKLCRKEDFVPF